MKRILAMALVGLLSISSLAEEEGLGVQPTEPQSDQPTTNAISCPYGYQFIKFMEGKIQYQDFCIAEKVQNAQSKRQAMTDCENTVYFNRKAYLCDDREWNFACKNNGEELKMGKDNGGSAEWVANYNNTIGGLSGCRSPTLGKVSPSGGVRCCFR